MPPGTALPKVEATRSYGAEVRLTGVVVEDALAAAHDLRTRNTTRTSCRRSTIGWSSPARARWGSSWPRRSATPRWCWSRSAAAGSSRGWPPPWRSNARTCGWSASRPPGPRRWWRRSRPARRSSCRRCARSPTASRSKSPSALTFAHVQALVDDVVTVTDEEIGRALILLLERAKAVVEPSGAVGLAALLAGQVAGSGPAAVVLSGGNVDSLMLTRLVEHGLSAAGRYLRLRVVVPDRPGALAGITQTVADLGINVLAVEHHRAGVQVGLGDVEVLLTLETRDAEHRRQVVAALLERGVVVEPLG